MGTERQTETESNEKLENILMRVWCTKKRWLTYFNICKT